MANTKVPSELVSNQVFGRRNLFINGDMQVAQRGTSGTLASGYETVDRWESVMSSAGTWTVSQSTTVPSGEGFAYSQKLNCETADASLDASNFLLWRQKIEGINLQHLKYGTSSAEKLTLSFWVRSAKTGTYIVELNNENSGGAKKQSQSYTISSANTWEKKTITYAGDTATAFENTTDGELLVYFWLAAGSTYAGGGSLNTSWNSGVANNTRVVGQVNLADSTSNDWYITGVQLEVGSDATPFEHLTFDEQDSLCKRYYQQYSGFHAMAMWTYGRSNASMQFVLEKEMRSQPSASYSGTLGGLNNANECGIYESDWVNISSITLSPTSHASGNSKMIRIDSAHSTNAFASNNVAVGFYAGDNFYFIFDAEL
jgi:hypothetical protein